MGEKRQVVAITASAMKDPRFRNFANLPEDAFEAFLSVPILAGVRLIGVMNLQHLNAKEHSAKEIKLVETIGNLVGAEVERARLD